MEKAELAGGPELAGRSAWRIDAKRRAGRFHEFWVHYRLLDKLLQKSYHLSRKTSQPRQADDNLGLPCRRAPNLQKWHTSCPNHKVGNAHKVRMHRLVQRFGSGIARLPIFSGAFVLSEAVCSTIMPLLPFPGVTYTLLISRCKSKWMSLLR